MLSWLFLALIILIIPQLNNTELMDSTQSGKAFGFLWAMLGYIVMLIIITAAAVNHKAVHIKITLVDIILGVFCVMEAIYYWRKPGDQLKMMTFGGLIVFYLSVRTLNLKYIYFLFIAIVISGATQAIYGNLQLWGYYPSNHGLFKMTGSFFNPGPYAGYLAAVFPISLCIYLFGIPSENTKPNSVVLKLLEHYNVIKSTLGEKLSKTIFISNYFSKSTTGTQEVEPKRIISDLFKSIALISIISMLLVLPATRSRAAWLAVLVSSFYLISVKYQLARRIKIFFNTYTKKIFLIVLLTFLVIISGAGLYHFKKGSADGRLLIWKVSAEMIKDKPVLGHGTGKFAADYMNYQAAYFQPNPDSPESLRADNVTYAYNELLKLTVEKGIIGLLLAGSVIWCLYFVKTESGENSNVNLSLLAARGGLLSVVVFALFSYPSEILPIKMLFVLFVGVIATHQKSMHIIQFPAKETALLNTVRFATLAVVLLTIYPAEKYLTQQYKAYKTWKDASDIYNAGAYSECLEDFEMVYPNLKTNGVFLIQYGKALEMAEKYENSIAILNEAKQHLNNTILYTCLGNNYKALGKNNESEQAYINAWHMAPVKFYPLYLVAKLYDEIGQPESAKAIAKKVLEKKIKIDSPAIKEIQEEMEKLVKKGKVKEE